MSPAVPWAGLLHWAEVTPDQPALVFADETTSYAELAELALRGARFLCTGPSTVLPSRRLT